MGSRLHTTLIYFGIGNDAAEAQRLETSSMNGWRIAAVTLALAVTFAGCTALAVGLLLLSGVGTVPKALAWLLDLIVVAALIARFNLRVRRRRETRKLPERPGL
jgi:hypothetical protein